jgi:Leucine-rich repeat (LRR) protein
MNAGLSPWEGFLPKTQEWHRIGGTRSHDAEARFVYLDTRATPLKVLGGFKNLQGVWLGSATESDLKSLAQLSSLSVVRLVAPHIASLSPLRHLPNLEGLVLDEPPTLNGLDRLANLRCLVMRHFPRVKSLSPLAALTQLRVVSFSTIPSWDASRRCLKV